MPKFASGNVLNVAEFCPRVLLDDSAVLNFAPDHLQTASPSAVCLGQVRYLAPPASGTKKLQLYLLEPGSRICLRTENLPPEKFSPCLLSFTPLWSNIRLELTAFSYKIDERSNNYVYTQGRKYGRRIILNLVWGERGSSKIEILHLKSITIISA